MKEKLSQDTIINNKKRAIRIIISFFIISIIMVISVFAENIKIMLIAIIPLVYAFFKFVGYVDEIMIDKNWQKKHKKYLKKMEDIQLQEEAEKELQKEREKQQPDKKENAENEPQKEHKKQQLEGKDENTSKSLEDIRLISITAKAMIFMSMEKDKNNIELIKIKSFLISEYDGYDNEIFEILNKALS